MSTMIRRNSHLFSSLVLLINLCIMYAWFLHFYIFQPDKVIDFSLPQISSYRIAEKHFDIEAAREASKDEVVYVCSNKVLRKNFIYHEEFAFPFHIRYHRASNASKEILFYFLKIRELDPQHPFGFCNNKCTFRDWRPTVIRLFSPIVMSYIGK